MKNEEMGLLIEAFEAFNRATQQLKDSYRALEEQVKILKKELEKKEEQLQRSIRLASMGEMAVKIAHEIRNPLGSIELFASLLRKELENDEANKILVDYIISEAKSLNQVVCNMLLFTRSLSVNYQPLKIHQLIDESLIFASHIIKDTQVEIIKHYDGPSLLMGDRELLKQLFLNLILNAFQAMINGGRLTISTQSLRREASEFLEIKFADSGMGIPEEIRGKIFNPFFTTKEGGTGLGLTIVHNVVEAHGGNVWFEVCPGTGTTFTVILPVKGKN